MPRSTPQQTLLKRLAGFTARVAVPFAAAAVGWLAAEFALAKFGGAEYVRFAFLAGSLGASILLAVVWSLYERKWRRRVERLQGLLLTDPATDVLNRKGLEAELRRVGALAKRAGYPVCLVRVSVDQAAALGGLPVEQRRTLANAVIRCISAGRRGEDAVARLGAFDFALVMPRCDALGGQTVAERVRDAVRRTTFLVEGKPQRLTLSIGLADLARNEPLSLMVRLADKALVRARRIGNTVVTAEAPTPAAMAAPVENDEPVLFGWDAAALEDRPVPEEDITDEADAVIFDDRKDRVVGS